MTDTGEHLAAIAEVVRDYVEGMVQADEEKLRRVMHPRACEIGHFDGDLLWQDREAMIAMIREEGSPPDMDPKWRIRSVTVEGDLAAVCVEDDWAGLSFVDVLTLLHHDGRWMIVAKGFHVCQPG